MDPIFKALDGFEAALTTLVTWAMNVPKTLLWIIFYPDEVPGYVRKLLPLQADEQEDGLAEKQPHAPYSNFLRPVALLLTVALIPALFYRFTPQTGVIINKPVETADAGTETLKAELVAGDTYTATARFAIPANLVQYRFDWTVTDSSFQNIATATHVELQDSGKNIRRSKESENAVEDSFSYAFLNNGTYYVRVAAYAMDKSAPDKILVSHTTTIEVLVDSKNGDTPAGEIKLDNRQKILQRQKEIQSLTVENFSKSLSAQSTVFLALVMLIPPFLFAFVSLNVTKRKITETSIKRTFYAECYYFSPLSLAIWTFYYSNTFFSADTSWGLGNWTIYVPLLAAVVWFVAVESKALSDVSEDDTITFWRATLVVVSCLILISGLAFGIYLLQSDSFQNFLRVNLIRIYILTGVFLLGNYSWNRWKSKRPAQVASAAPEQQPAKPRRTFRKIVLPIIGGTIVVCCLLSALIIFVPVDDTAATPTPTVAAAAVTSTAAVQDAEALIGKSKDWGPIFMINGSSDQAKTTFGNDGVRFQVSEQQDQIPQAYYINNIALYTDVVMEAVVKNNGNPSNGLSLICRYDPGAGWYEIEVSNAGQYTIYAFDAINYTYEVLATGQAKGLLEGIAENTYTAGCQGNELSLKINGTPQITILDTEFNFKQGNIGISLYSPDGRAVDVNIQSLKVTGEPAEQQGSVDGTDAPIFNTPVPVADVNPGATSQPESTATIPVESIESASFFTDEFDGTLERWETLGDASQLKLPPENGSLHFQLAQKDGQTPPVYLINSASVYTDVQVTVMTTNNGNNSNGVDLVCRANEKGWYEFEVSNSGSYAIYALDLTTGNYTLLTAGDSATIKTGLSQNLYSAVCKGTRLTLLVNETEAASIEETAFNFEEGEVGFGVSSRKGFPVDLYIDFVTVSKP